MNHIVCNVCGLPVSISDLPIHKSNLHDYKGRPKRRRVNYDTVLELWVQGVATSAIANRFHCDSRTVRRILDKMGVPERPNGPRPAAFCQVRGCGRPLYRRSTRCHIHQVEYWREWYKMRRRRR